MTTRIAHISDLHFGAAPEGNADRLESDLNAMNPRIICVSGDLTQRARRSEFQAAAEFLARFDVPKIVVPGNHDVPLYDVVRRFASPLGRFRRYIGPVADPFYADDELAVLGLNTARSLTWKNGRISTQQIRRITDSFHSVPGRVTRVIVTHHPFLPNKGEHQPALVARGRAALAAFEAVGGDLVLSGHLHLGFTSEVSAYHVEVKRSIMAIQAGTAISHRMRGEPNAYNVIDVDGNRLVVEVRALKEGRFESASFARFRKKDERWTAVPVEGQETQQGHVPPRPDHSIKAGTGIRA
jgi:3',5'-cyclic AMP phosphodiesterase CpdA